VAHPDVILLVFGKRLFIGPAFHLQIGDNMLTGRCRCFITPPPPHFFNPGAVVPEPAVVKPVGRAKSEFIEPPMNLLIRLPAKSDGFGAVLFEGRHSKSLHPQNGDSFVDGIQIRVTAQFRHGFQQREYRVVEDGEIR